MHKSVGAIIKDNKGRILMMDRKNFPFGWACPAGHIDPGEAPENAMRREVKEETNLDAKECKLLVHEFVPWNECSKGAKGHDWYVYEVTKYAGSVGNSAGEAKETRWISAKNISGLNLEKVWRKWFEDLNIIQ